MVKCIVRDYGKGIPNEIRDRLFRRMVTQKVKWNGTEPVIVLFHNKGQVRRELWVESKENEGSAFYVTIPLTTGNDCTSFGVWKSTD